MVKVGFVFRGFSYFGKGPTLDAAKLDAFGQIVKNNEIELMIESSDTYVVQPGDSLISITRKLGRQASEWDILWFINTKIVPNQNVLHPGTKLTIPVSWRKNE